MIAELRGSRGIYHGRKVLAALFMAGFMVYGGGLYCFVLFVPPLTKIPLKSSFCKPPVAELIVHLQYGGCFWAWHSFLLSS